MSKNKFSEQDIEDIYSRLLNNIRKTIEEAEAELQALKK